MKFLALALALVISAEGIKVKSRDESHSKEKVGLKWGWFSRGPYYQWVTCDNTINGVNY